MKIKYPVIATIVLFIVIIAIQHIMPFSELYELITDVLGILFLISLALIVYAIIHTVIQATRRDR